MTLNGQSVNKKFFFYIFQRSYFVLSNYTINFRKLPLKPQHLTPAFFKNFVAGVFSFMESFLRIMYHFLLFSEVSLQFLNYLNIILNKRCFLLCKSFFYFIFVLLL